MKKYLTFILAFALTGCGAGGMMGDAGMMARHHAQVPKEYAGKTAPEATKESIARGAEAYKANCASCHGETGMGDGSAGKSLTPPPSAVAQTMQMLADDLIFYRISEGGAEFQTSMPPWKDILTEEQRWDVMAYVRALGKDNAAQIAQVRAAQQDAMLKSAATQGAITPAEADVFRTVHTALENYIQANPLQGTMSEREAAALAALIKQGTLTQKQADEFKRIQAVLSTGGFMP
jgi:mono/diheme cytochrome c family protein